LQSIIVKTICTRTQNYLYKKNAGCRTASGVFLSVTRLVPWLKIHHN
jgi:hypothetical protein